MRKEKKKERKENRREEREEREKRIQILHTSKSTYTMYIYKYVTSQIFHEALKMKGINIRSTVQCIQHTKTQPQYIKSKLELCVSSTSNYVSSTSNYVNNYLLKARSYSKCDVN